MEHYIEVIFRSERRGFFRNTKDLALEPDSVVICRVDRGEDIARVLNISLTSEEVEKPEETLEIVRLATEEDLKNLEVVRKREEEAKNKFLIMLQNQPFEMKLVDVIYQFDGNKLIFFFSADGRVDFREFVRQLATEFKTRIELHQTSGREDAKRYGGLGICGKEYCCALFLKNTHQVTIKMAKEQNLLSNLSKISGPCGRLLCCLKYERDFYLEKTAQFPTVGDILYIKGTRLRVVKNDFYKDTIQLVSEDFEQTILTLEEYNKYLRKKYKKSDKKPT